MSIIILFLSILNSSFCKNLISISEQNQLTSPPYVCYHNTKPCISDSTILWEVKIDSGHTYNKIIKTEIISDESKIYISENKIFGKDSINYFLGKINLNDKTDYINKKGLIWKHLEFDGFIFYLVKSKEYNIMSKEVIVFLLLIDKGDFNEDRADSFLYCFEYGVLSKNIRKGLRSFDQYRLISSPEMDKSTMSILDDGYFYPNTTKLIKNTKN